MNGYGSHRQSTATRFSAIQTITMTVWMTRKRPVPRKRAIRSENRPNASASTLEREPAARLRGWSSRCRAVIAHGTPRGCRVRSSLRRVPPVVGQQVVEHVVDGHRAEQVAPPRRRPGRTPGCRRRSSGSRSASGSSGRQRRQVGVDDAADQLERAARAAAAGCARSPGSARSGWPCGGRQHEDHATASAGVRSGSRTRASASATVASGAQHDRLGGHQAARGVGASSCSSRRTGAGLLGLHQARAAAPASSAGSSPSRSAASSGSIASSTSAARSASSVRAAARLVVLGQLLRTSASRSSSSASTTSWRRFSGSSRSVGRRRRAAASPARRAARPRPGRSVERRAR